MSREQERIRKKLENNPIAECNRIQNRFCPGLFSMFGSVKDPRHQSYIDYSARVMLGTMYYKSIAGISSMQEMTRTFNDERICRNLYRFMGEHEKDYMPHGVVCSKRLLNQAVGKSLRTHNLKPKKGAQVMRKSEKITALYERLSRDDFGKDDDQQRESNSISNQKASPASTSQARSFTAISGTKPEPNGRLTPKPQRWSSASLP